MFALLALILLGLIQGLTEFLPVSSSGHLTMFQYFSKDLHEDLSLNIAVHIGTLLTVVIYYRRDLLQMLRGVLAWQKEEVNMTVLILVASLPTAVIGIFMKKNLDWVLVNPWVAGLCLFVTGLLLFFSDRIQVKNNFQTGFGIGIGSALLIGLVQGFAVLPGISRSGSTIVAGLMLGMNPKNASRFSFLVSLPAIAGAGLLEFMDLDSKVNFTNLGVGMFISFLTGLVAISWMVSLTMGGKLKSFSYYLFFVSIGFTTCLFLGIGQGIL